jgi:hypothetical protein
LTSTLASSEISEKPSAWIVPTPPAKYEEIRSIEDSNPNKKIGFKVEMVKKINQIVLSISLKKATAIGIVVNIVSWTKA